MCLFLTWDYPLQPINIHFRKSHDLKKGFYLHICYFPTFPFNWDHKANTHAPSRSCARLWRESSVESRPLQGFPTVLLVHPSQCTVSTSAWGKGRGLRASFPTWGQRESVPDLHMPSPFCVAASVRVWGGPKDQCDSPDPGSFQWSRTSAVFPLPGSLQRPRLYYFS